MGGRRARGGGDAKPITDERRATDTEEGGREDGGGVSEILMVLSFSKHSSATSRDFTDDE